MGGGGGGGGLFLRYSSRQAEFSTRTSKTVLHATEALWTRAPNEAISYSEAGQSIEAATSEGIPRSNTETISVVGNQ